MKMSVRNRVYIWGVYQYSAIPANTYVQLMYASLQGIYFLNR